MLNIVAPITLFFVSISLIFRIVKNPENKLMIRIKTASARVIKLFIFVHEKKDCNVLTTRKNIATRSATSQPNVLPDAAVISNKSRMKNIVAPLGYLML